MTSFMVLNNDQKPNPIKCSNINNINNVNNRINKSCSCELCHLQSCKPKNYSTCDICSERYFLSSSSSSSSCNSSLQTTSSSFEL